MKKDWHWTPVGWYKEDGGPFPQKEARSFVEPWCLGKRKKVGLACPLPTLTSLRHYREESEIGIPYCLIPLVLLGQTP